MLSWDLIKHIRVKSDSEHLESCGLQYQEGSTGSAAQQLMRDSAKCLLACGCCFEAAWGLAAQPRLDGSSGDRAPERRARQGRRHEKRSARGGPPTQA
jgi:hypothetical protein